MINVKIEEIVLDKLLMVFVMIEILFESKLIINLLMNKNKLEISLICLVKVLNVVCFFNL